MKILITGGKGQLGQDVTTLLEQKHAVISCSSTELDIGNRIMVEKAFATHQPEVVLNCAAYTAVDNCETEKELAWRVNATGPENLAVACEDTGCRLIHISTDYVFDGKKSIDTSYTESDPVMPHSEYGKSKLAGEDAIARFAADYLIMRTAWLYGAKGNNFLKTMLRLALADPEREVKVVNDQYGSLTWTTTLAEQIEAVLTPELQGIVHATANGSSTWYEGACYFLDAMAVPYTFVPCSTAEYPLPAPRPENSILENSRLKEAGVSVFRSWQDDIDKFVMLCKGELIQSVT